MFDRLSRSWELGKSSWGMLTANPTLMAFPVIAAIGMLISSVIIGGIGFTILAATTGIDNISISTDNAPGAVIVAAILFAATAITIYFNTALTGMVLRQIDGQPTSLSDGITLANSRLRPIFGWAAVSTTVGLILSILRDRAGWAGSIISFLGEMAWGLATFFVVPILATHNIGPIDAIKQSAGLFKRTWGEQVIGQFGIGLFAFIISIPALLLGVLFIGIGVASGNTVVLILMIALAVLAFGAVAAVSSTLSSIYRTVLYRWATTGDVAPGFNATSFNDAFAPKPNRRIMI